MRPAYLEPNRGMHKYGCVRINPKNSYLHEKAKFDRAYQLLKEGYDIITEAEFTNGRGRADLIDLTNNRAYEFAKSEEENSLIKKARKYPIPFAVERIR